MANDIYEEFEAELQTIVAELSKPLSQNDVDDSWTEESRKEILYLFTQLQIDIKEGKIPREYIRYLTADSTLGSYGIHKGSLYDLASQIFRTLKIDIDD